MVREEDGKQEIDSEWPKCLATQCMHKAFLFWLYSAALLQLLLLLVATFHTTLWHQMVILAETPCPLAESFLL